MKQTEGLSPPAWLRSSWVAWAGALVVCIGLALPGGFLLYESQELDAAELQRAELYARVLQDHAERAFNTIDSAMDALAETLAAPPRTEETGRLDNDLAHALNGLPFIRSLSLLNARGLVVASSAAANVGVEVDLKKLRLPSSTAADSLGSSISGRDLADIRQGHTTRPGGARTFVPLLRMMNSHSGEPLFIAAILNPEFFGNEYELTLADETRAAGIFSIDSVMLAGTGNLALAPGQSVREHRFFTAFLPARESGSFIGAGIDGKKVVTAFRVLRKRPLVVIVERDFAHVQASFRHTIFWTVGMAGGALLLLCAMMLMAWRSIRAREAAQAALEATRSRIATSERDLRSLVESVHELIFRADETGRIVFVNGRWTELTKRPASDAIGKRIADLCREDERAACLSLFSRPETNDEMILLHVLDASGASLTLDLSVSRVLGSEGQAGGFAGFAVNVTEREAAQQALQSQLKFTAQLLEVSPTPIFVKDQKGRFVSVNRAWLDLMNLSLPDVLGRTSDDLFGPEASKHKDQDARLLESELRISYENRLLVEGRKPRDTVVTKVRFTRADGTAAGMVGSIIDVTEFREAERNIRLSRDAAERANSAKSDFIANISHELRTPLQGIIGFSEIGRDMAAGHPDFLDMFADIHAGGQRMLMLVNGLLDVSQMDSAVGSMPLQTADVAQLVREVVSQFKPKAVVRDLQINVTGLSDTVTCQVDPARYQQALHNVLANAVRYSPVGGVIEIELKDRGAAGSELSVRDHGPGVPEQELELIFEAFVQSSRTRDGSGGTGLGLTISRKIMRAHGGAISAANAPGGGAVFKLSLPAVGRPAELAAEQPWRGGEATFCEPGTKP